MATIGTDPELIVMRGNRSISAQEFIRDIRGMEYDYGQVGRDAAGGPLELRPRPSFRPRDVVISIGRLLGSCLGIIPPTSYLCCGGYDREIGGIGGHLHAWGRGKTRSKLDSGHNKGRVCLGLSLLWALEDFHRGMERRLRGYGGINDVRRSQPAYEFRSPSSDWLASPSLAFHSLSYFQTLVDRLGEYGRDTEELNSILKDSLQYWTQGSSQTFREKYLGRILDLVKPISRPKDLSAIMFFSQKLSNIREQDSRLVRIDIDKWRRKAGCVD